MQPSAKTRMEILADAVQHGGYAPGGVRERLDCAALAHRGLLERASVGEYRATTTGIWILSGMRMPWTEKRRIYNEW